MSSSIGQNSCQQLVMKIVMDIEILLKKHLISDSCCNTITYNPPKKITRNDI